MNHARDEIEPERYELSDPPRYSFELQRRDFLRVVGAGLVVAVTVPRGAAEQTSGAGSQGRSDSEIAAWLHIDERGRVTAYTGKVEIGQNIRTSLAQTVADELRVPIAAITMVMADTDLVPFDRGTFGSRTTPFMAPQLARAAAAAREMLIDRAATRWSVDRQNLKAADGGVARPDGRILGYGELVKEQRLAGIVPEAPPTSSAAQWQLRGKPERKVAGRDFVTGGHRFTPDVSRPGVVYGSVVRPPSVGATLTGLDDRAARAMTGVTVVRDGAFLGVTAPSDRLARRAATAIMCEWKEQTGQPSSESLFDYIRHAAAASGASGGGTPYITGDVSAVRATAARTFEASYRIPYIAHVPLEPRAAVAEWTGGKLTVWTGTQRPFGVRDELKEAFRLSDDRVRVIVPDTGSAYGGKHTADAAIEAARLARAVGRPVKLVWTRAEEFAHAYFRPAGVIDIKASVDGAERIQSWEFDNWNSGAAAIRSPYDVPNQRIAFHPIESPLRQGSYRGLAATANNYAREMHIDAIARQTGTDPVAFRLNHLTDERLEAVLRTAAEKGGWGRSLPAGRARGIACGTEKGSFVATVADLSRAATGFRVEKILVVFECGAIVNPDGVRNQVEGCVVQALGGALFEAIEFARGRVLNGSMEQYRVPRFKDTPPIEIVLLDRRDLPSAGAGETPIIAVAPAIGSAARAFGEVAPALPVTFRA
jgi:isoquinoline 1-oxidoreductase